MSVSGAPVFGGQRRVPRLPRRRPRRHAATARRGADRAGPQLPRRDGQRDPEPGAREELRAPLHRRQPGLLPFLRPPSRGGRRAPTTTTCSRRKRRASSRTRTSRRSPANPSSTSASTGSAGGEVWMWTRKTALARPGRQPGGAAAHDRHHGAAHRRRRAAQERAALPQPRAAVLRLVLGAGRAAALLLHRRGRDRQDHHAGRASCSAGPVTNWTSIWESDAVRDEHRRDLEARRPFRDLVLTSRDNGRSILVSGEPMFDADGRFRGYRGVARDITADQAGRARGPREPSLPRGRDQHGPHAHQRQGRAAPVPARQRCVLRLGGPTQGAADRLDRRRWWWARSSTSASATPMPRRWRAASRSNTRTACRSATASNGTLVRKTGLARSDGSRVVVSAFIDISNLKAIESQLRVSERRFRDFAEAAGEYVWETDAEGRFTFVSSRVRSVIGYDDAELVGRTGGDFMPPGEYERVLDVDPREPHRGRRVPRPRAPVRHPLRRDCCWVQVNAVSLTDAEGHFAGFRGTCRNITDRRKAEERISYLATRDPLTDLPNRAAVQRPPRTGAGQRAAQARSAGADVHRPRPLQEHQRLARSPRGRPAAAGSRGAHAGVRAQGRHAVAPRRRRVRGDARRPAARGRRRPGGAEDHPVARPADGDRRPHPDHLVLHRHQHLPRRCRGLGRAHEERRHGHVPREGKGPAQLPVLLARDEHPRGGAPQPRHGAAPRARSRRVRALLPAADRHRHRTHRRVRSPAALAPSGKGPAAAVHVHRRGRGNRPHRTHRTVGAARRLHAEPHLAERRLPVAAGGGQHLRDGSSTSRASSPRPSAASSRAPASTPAISNWK